ncbi:DUF1289 domain-containing protein [uncultured Sphingomonas sp.]|uniref:DUF1289 domain-containing protein n=1 Tax=uncultured Sphingomonas sp. TaxID=158754 RepID=UPI0035CBD7D1
MTDSGATAALEGASPCNQVCTLDADDVCAGCGRTIDEIASWGALPLPDRRAILAALPARLAKMRG